MAAKLRFRFNQRLCTTCAWWNGPRGVEFHGLRPYCVWAEGVVAPCMARPTPCSPGNGCSRWQLWEKIED